MKIRLTEEQMREFNERPEVKERQKAYEKSQNEMTTKQKVIVGGIIGMILSSLYNA